jgi:threonine dehydratase
MRGRNVMSISAESIAREAELAAQRLAEYVVETPMVFSTQFSQSTGANVWLKLENLQDTGSFKLRGATNRLLAMSGEERGKGCVTASSGNHGAGVARAAARLGMRGIVFVPQHTSQTKVAAIRAYGGEVRHYGTDGLDTEQHARQFAVESGRVFVSPYNDPDVVAGQGSCGVEIARQLQDIDAAFISIGGGGLISGVASVLKRHNPSIRIIGCQPSASPVMTKSIEAGRVLELESLPTLSDGTAGGVEQDSITFELCRELVDDYVLVDEDAIAAAMIAFIDKQHQLAEGAAGVALAAFLARADEFRGKNVVILICGGNVSLESLRKILC